MSLSDKIISWKDFPQWIPFQDVKEFIKLIESDILDLSILEINKDLTISELVEKAINKIRERAGDELI